MDGRRSYATNWPGDEARFLSLVGFTHSSFDQSLHVKKYMYNKNEHRLQVILLLLFGDIRWDVNWSAVSTNITCSVFRSIFNTACECNAAQ